MMEFSESGIMTISNVYTISRCGECGEEFNEKLQLYRHLKQHKEENSSSNPNRLAPLLADSSESIYECNVCQRIFINQVFLNKHEDIHKGLHPYKCAECDKQFDNCVKLQAHINKHALKRASTEKSHDKTLTKGETMCSDLKNGHDKQQSTAQKVLPTATKIKTSHSTVPKKVPPKRDVKANDFRTKKHKLKQKDLSAKIVSKTFNSKQLPMETNVSVNFKNVNSTNRSVKPVFTNEKTHTDGNQLSTKAQMNTRNLLLCDECDIEVSQTNDLGTRDSKRQSNDNIKCIKCKKTFKSKADLERHSEKHDRPKRIQKRKRHPCVTCTRVFSSKMHLEIHTRSHTGEKPYECHLCDMAFTGNPALQAHIERHSRVHLKCKVCGRKCSTKKRMKIHMTLHTGEKPFKCLECGKSYVDKYALKTHSRQHTGEGVLSCDQCSMKFTAKSLFDRHVLSHTGEKPFKCSECGKGFTSKGSLNIHLKIHTGERPFVCKTCNKGFRTSWHLHSHEVTHVWKSGL